MAKLLRRPVNDDLFNSFTALDWGYYSAQLKIDQEEEIETDRDLAEYQAMFSNPEGVRKVKTMRAQREANELGELEPGRTVSADDDKFAKFIAAGGRDAPKFKKRI